jgi:uncharacterized protein involved in response to NO
MLSVGYRPFFLLAALNAWAAMLPWLYVLSGGHVATQGWPPQTLHAHEMIYGTVVPVIAGFLLTAVPNWTATARVSGNSLLGLVLLYSAGRLALVLSGSVSAIWVASVDVAFLPALAWFIGRPIVTSRIWRNLPVVAVVIGLAVANVAIHRGLDQSDHAMLRTGTYASVYLVVVMMMIISGRVIPAFTRNALMASGIDAAILDRAFMGPLAVATALAALLADLIQPGSFASAILALAAAPLLLIRQSGWQFRRTLDRPMLWILHLGHAWLAVGFAYLGISGLFDIGIAAAPLHAFTAGAMGTLILGMMSRVALGHSGRPIEATTSTVWMFALVIAGAGIRVIGASGPVELYRPSLLLGGGLWVAAWILFGVAYSKILLTPAE